MAAYSITAGNVMPGAGVTVQTGIAGGAITAGQALYIDTANANVLKLAQADGTDLEATVAGIALNTCASGQYVTYATKGLVTLGSGVFPGIGRVVVLDTTAGSIAPVADLADTEKVVIIGFAKTTSQIDLRIINTGVAQTTT